MQTVRDVLCICWPVKLNIVSLFYSLFIDWYRSLGVWVSGGSTFIDTAADKAHLSPVLSSCQCTLCNTRLSITVFCEKAATNTQTCIVCDLLTSHDFPRLFYCACLSVQELLGQATEILEDMQRLKARSSRPACDVSDITQRLTVTLQPFTQHLQGFQDVYVAVHIFHLLLEKVSSTFVLRRN